ncbi:MAG: LysR substrate-binding domain-containing protein [Terrimicrobiaceae bacterium]
MPSLEWRASHGDCCALRGRVFSERVTSGRGCMNSRRFTVSSILGVREAVMAGAGLNAGPLWLYADAIDRGELIRVLPAWNPPRYPVHAFMQAGRYRPAKTNRALAMLRVKVPKLPGVIG